MHQLNKDSYVAANNKGQNSALVTRSEKLQQQ